MTWRIIDKLQNDKVVETHQSPYNAQRALHILTAHELKNGRKAHYAITPEIVEARPPTLDELNLPSWAYDALMNAVDDKKLAEVREALAAEEGFIKKYAHKGETLEDAKKRIAEEAKNHTNKES